MEASNSQYLKAKKGVLEIIASLPGEEPMIQSERNLALKLGVSRGILRLVMDELVLSGNIFKRPRLGTFANRRSRTRSFGVLCGNGSNILFVDWALRILCGVVEALAGKGAGFLPLSSSNAIAEFPSLRCKNDLDGLLWIFPPSSALPTLAKAIDDGFPLSVFLCSAEDLRSIPLKANFVAWDSAFIGRQRARFFLRSNLQRIGELESFGTQTFQNFEMVLAQAGCPFQERLHFARPEYLKIALPSILAEGALDGLVAIGSLCHIQLVLEALHAVKARKPISLLLPDMDGVRQLLAKFPSDDSIAFSRTELELSGRHFCEAFLLSIGSGNPQSPIFVRPRILSFSGEILDNGEEP